MIQQAATGVFLEDLVLHFVQVADGVPVAGEIFAAGRRGARTQARHIGGGEGREAGLLEVGRVGRAEMEDGEGGLAALLIQPGAQPRHQRGVVRGGVVHQRGGMGIGFERRSGEILGLVAIQPIRQQEVRKTVVVEALNREERRRHAVGLGAVPEQRLVVIARAALHRIHPGEEARQRHIGHGRGRVGAGEGEGLARAHPRREFRHETRIEGVAVQAFMDEHQHLKGGRRPLGRLLPRQRAAQPARADASRAHLRRHHQQRGVGWLEARGGDEAVEPREHQHRTEQLPPPEFQRRDLQCFKREGARDGAGGEGERHAEAEALLEEQPSVARLGQREFHGAVIRVGALVEAVADAEAEPHPPSRAEGSEELRPLRQGHENERLPQQPAEQRPREQPGPFHGSPLRAQPEQQRQVREPVQRQPTDQRPGHQAFGAICARRAWMRSWRRPSTARMAAPMPFFTAWPLLLPCPMTETPWMPSSGRPPYSR